MFLSRSTLHTSLFGLVGFYSSDDPDYPTLSPSLLTSRSARYFNQVHSLLTIENIHQSIKNFGQYSYPAFTTSSRDAGDYVAGSKIKFSGNNYEYIASTASSAATPDPGADANVWRSIDVLSDYLTKAVYAGIDEMLDRYVNAKKMRGKIKSVFNDVLLFNGVGNYRSAQTNQDKFVGLRIRMRKGERHLVTILNKVGLQFDQVITGGEELNLKLYHSSQPAAIATWTITHETAKAVKWTTLTSDNVLRYLSDSHDAGGDFYIGYKQSELDAMGTPPKAINKDVFWSQKPCDCDEKWSDYWKQYSPFVDIMGFEVLESDMPGDALPDLTKIGLTNIVNYGINLNLTTKCDLAPFFIQEEETLAEALQYSVGRVLLEAIANNTRKGNTTANTIRSMAAKELYNHKEAWGTVHDKAVAAAKGLEIDFSDMEDSCMPNDDPGTIDVEVKSW